MYIIIYICTLHVQYMYMYMYIVHVHVHCTYDLSFPFLVVSSLHEYSLLVYAHLFGNYRAVVHITVSRCIAPIYDQRLRSEEVCG